MEVDTKEFNFTCMLDKVKAQVRDVTRVVNPTIVMDLAMAVGGDHRTKVNLATSGARMNLATLDQHQGCGHQQGGGQVRGQGTVAI